MSAGVLYLCGTPIGNLEDISVRAIRVLRAVDIIAAEDTRRARKLLARYRITTRLISCHEHNERSRAPELVESMRMGSDIAFVSDAGTPAVSDPGTLLVRLSVEAGIRVVPVPGPSAAVLALAVSGFKGNRYVVEGFLPTSGKRRRKRLVALAGDPRAVVFFEAPHRVVEMLEDVEKVLGDRRAVLCRELTKVHEEVVRGTVRRLRSILAERERVKGEITIVVEGGDVGEGTRYLDERQAVGIVEALVGLGVERMDAMRLAASYYGVSRRVVYDVVARIGRGEHS